MLDTVSPFTPHVIPENVPTPVEMDVLEMGPEVSDSEVRPPEQVTPANVPMPELDIPKLVLDKDAMVMPPEKVPWVEERLVHEMALPLNAEFIVVVVLDLPIEIEVEFAPIVNSPTLSTDPVLIPTYALIIPPRFNVPPPVLNPVTRVSIPDPFVKMAPVVSVPFTVAELDEKRFVVNPCPLK